MSFDIREQGEQDELEIPSELGLCEYLMIAVVHALCSSLDCILGSSGRRFAGGIRVLLLLCCMLCRVRSLVRPPNALPS